jgi:hypothetical protein
MAGSYARNVGFMLSQSRAERLWVSGRLTRSITLSDVMSVGQNLFSGIPSKLKVERIDKLVESVGLRIERIITTAHASLQGPV